MQSSERDSATEPNRRSSDPRLAIGAFARRSLLSMKALRLYDRMGLLIPAEVDPVNGYRLYRQSQLETARLISMLRRVEMPLAEVATIIATDSDRRSQALLQYWERVEHRHAGHRETVAYLEHQMAGDVPPIRQFEIRERDVPDQVVLTEQRHITVDALSGWIGRTIDSLMTIAIEHDGPVAPVFVVYHGSVNEDSDGPVEVCVPVPPELGDDPRFATRIEPAHHEGYTVLRRAQIAFPQILSGYDAVGQWAVDIARHITGSPREIYFTDFMSAGPHDEVCDIALPVERRAHFAPIREMTGTMALEVKERDIGAQAVLTEQRNILQPELVDWMGAAFGRLWERAGQAGGMRGPVLAIYHGVVDATNDGPVEVAGPVGADEAAKAGFETREEPAHREAYVTLPKRMVRFPEILEGYNAVEAYTRENGKQVIGSPREVYFADFMNAGPDDDVIDIAIPIT